MIRTLVGKASWYIVGIFFLAACVAAFQLHKFEVDAGTNVLLNEDDPDLAYYNLTRAEWEYDDYAIVCARRDNWFTPESIEVLKGFEEALLQAPHVKKTTSILSVPLLRYLMPLSLARPPTLAKPKVNLKKAHRELVKEKHTQAIGNLISEDGKNISILVHLDVPERMIELEPQWSRAQGEENEARIAELRSEYESVLRELRARRKAMVDGIRAVAVTWSGKMEGPVRLSGIPILNINLIEHVEADIRTFGIASFAFFTFAFLLFYRRLRWTAGPILACLVPVVLVIGTMAMTGKAVTVITSNLPVLLFVLMLPYTVYFVERYRERRSLRPDESNAETTIQAAREVATPCLYSCMTTMAGFASLLTSGINPVRTFGMMMAIGMAVGLACVLFFLPSLTKSLRPLAGGGSGKVPEPSGVVKLFAAAVLRVPVLVVLISVVVLGAAIWGITRIKVETKFIDYFWPSSEVYQGLEYIDTRMGGTTPFEVMLTSETEGFFKTPEGLAAISAASSFFDTVKEAGNVRSFRTLLDEGGKALPKASDEQLVKIATRLAMSQVREFCNEDFTVSRILVRFHETAPTLHRNNILRKLNEHLKAAPELKGLKEVRPTGVFLLYANMLNSLVKSQRDTFLIVLGAIAAMLLLLFRSPLLALVVLVPQSLPAVVCLGAMGWVGIPLDLVTVMIASIAMGVGIDAAIQYTVRFKRELAVTGGDHRAAVSRAHATIGRAIWIATSIVVLGFMVLVFSEFVPTVTFGIFTAVAMLMGQLASLTLLPSLFVLFRLPRPAPPASNVTS